MKKGRTIALLPILVFLVLYLGLGLLFEYGMKIPMGFYNIPIVVVFLAALLVACLQNRGLSFDEKLALLKGAEAHSTVILSHVDEDLFKKLGVNISFEPKYQAKKLYHK